MRGRGQTNLDERGSFEERHLCYVTLKFSVPNRIHLDTNINIYEPSK